MRARNTGSSGHTWKKTRGADGQTPRQRLDSAKADLTEHQLEVARGKYIEKAMVDQQRRECAEQASADLRHTLPLGVSEELAGKVDPGVARDAVRRVVERIIVGWQQGGIIDVQ